MSRRGRSLLALVPTLSAVILGGVWQAGAQPPAAMAAQQSPPTTSLVDALLQGLFPTTSTTLPPAAPTPSAPEGPASEDDPASTPDSEETPDPADRTIPPEAQRIINSVLRTGSNNTTALLAALRPLTDAGMTEEEAAILGFGQFPVAGEAWWSDDWLHPRFTPEFHFHQGTDIFAARGTPVRAPVDGTLEFSDGGAGGLGAWVNAGDGTLYYMAHLDGFARDKHTGMRVKQGEVVGFVGSSGNADASAPHVHFQVHPGGGAPINPKPIIDRWLAEAIRNVPNILPAYEVGLPRPITAAGMLRRLDSGSLGAPVESDGPQLWATSVRRENGAIRVEGSSPAVDVPAPWDPRVRGAEARANERRRADQLAKDVLDPLTPRALEEVRVGGS